MSISGVLFAEGELSGKAAAAQLHFFSEETHESPHGY